MNPKLRPYQRADVEFALAKSPVRIINQNDTGLGKTIETIETVRLHERHRRVVVACGKSLVGKWAEEFENWGFDGPIVTVTGESGTKGKRAEIIDSFVHGALIANYDTIKTYLLERMKLFVCDWFIVDEAHHIKNRKSQLTQALHKWIHAENRVALTATPTDGNPADYWAILAFLFPNRYTSYWRFAEQYCEFHDNGFSTKAFARPKNLDALKAELAPFTISRLKADVLSDLPPVTLETVKVSLDAKIKKHYTRIKKDGITTNEADDLIVAENGLSRMMKCRQLINAPSILGIKGDSPKLDYLLEVIEGASRPVVVYSDFEEVVSWLAATIPYDSVSITGAVTGPNRDRAVRAVNSGQVRVCFITRAGGEGIDLVGADRLIFYDLPLSQVVYRQVLGRLDRIGQTNPVLITRLIAKGTVEERIMDLITSKVQYTDDMILKELSSP